MAWLHHAAVDRRRAALRRAAASAGRRAGRRLGFELCEQRLALATAAAIDGLSAVQPGEEVGGGLIMVEGHFGRDIQQAVDSATLTLYAFGAAADFTVFELNGNDVGVGFDAPVQTLTPAAPVNRNVPGILDNAFVDWSESDASPALGPWESSLNPESPPESSGPTAAGTSGGLASQVLPITPAPGRASTGDGGAIALAAFAGGARLGLPASGAATRLAADRVPSDERGGEASFVPTAATPVEGLRGRAVVYEVAQVDARREQPAEGRNAAEAGLAAAERAVAATSDPGGSRSNSDAAQPADGVATQRARGREPWLPTAARGRAPFQLTATADAAAAAAVARAETDRDSQRAGRLPAAATESSEAAPADGGAGAADRLTDVAQAALTDDRQRRWLGLAAALVVGAGPVSRFLLRRRKRAAVEQLPPERRCQASAIGSP